MGRTALLCVILATALFVGGCRKGRPGVTGGPSTQKGNRTPLHVAAENGDLEAVRSLLAQGADVNARDKRGETPLHKAVASASAGVVQLLITKGGDVNAKNESGHVPLDEVWYSRGGGEVAELLLRSGAHATPEHLNHAARRGYARAIELIIANGINVNSQDKEGSTPLLAAAEWGHKEAVELLLARGADVNARTTSRWHGGGLSALHLAAQHGHREVAELLVSHGAKVGAVDLEGRTPLHASMEGHDDDITVLLLGKGADVNAKDVDGQTPLYAAIQAGDGHAVQRFIGAGGDVKMKNAQGQSLLHMAVLSLNRSVRSDTIAPLIAGGADVDAVTPSGCTPLHYAARDGHVRAAELLLAHGADANAKTTSGQTPLHLAVRRGRDVVVTLLVEKGAEVTVKDRDGKTPLDYARAAGQGDLVAILTGDKRLASAEAERKEAKADSPAGQSESRHEPQTDVEKLVSGNCAFAVDLYQRLGAKEGNQVFSPYSISTALAMTYAGSRENTENEMAKTLYFSLGQRGLHPAFAEMQGMLNKVQAGGNIKLCIANSLWPQEGHPFLKEYLSLIEKNYGVSITAVDYRTDSAREAARQMINRWVENRTENKIQDVIQPQQLTDFTRLVLTNAIYFKGKWKNEFDPKDTKDAPFFLSAAVSIQVPTMHQEEVFGYAETKSLQILEMPYRGGELSMLVLLPTRIEGLKQLEHSLTVENLPDWRSHLGQRNVIVFLPKFRLTFQAELKATLQSMGMVDAFKWPGANFAGFDGDPNWFYIGEVIHKAYVDVSEEGTEAAAATAVEAMLMGRPSQPPVFRADHPFLFLIQENSTGSILFMGRVADPTQAEQPAS